MGGQARLICVLQADSEQIVDYLFEGLIALSPTAFDGRCDIIIKGQRYTHTSECTALMHCFVFVSQRPTTNNQSQTRRVLIQKN